MNISCKVLSQLIILYIDVQDRDVSEAIDGGSMSTPAVTSSLNQESVNNDNITMMIKPLQADFAATESVVASSEDTKITFRKRKQTVSGISTSSEPTRASTTGERKVNFNNRSMLSFVTDEDDDRPSSLVETNILITRLSKPSRDILKGVTTSHSVIDPREKLAVAKVSNVVDKDTRNSVPSAHLNPHIERDVETFIGDYIHKLDDDKYCKNSERVNVDKPALTSSDIPAESLQRYINKMAQSSSKSSARAEDVVTDMSSRKKQKKHKHDKTRSTKSEVRSVDKKDKKDKKDRHKDKRKDKSKSSTSDMQSKHKKDKKKSKLKVNDDDSKSSESSSSSSDED